MGDNDERAEREPERGSGGRAPNGVKPPGQTPGGAETFLSIFMQKKWPNVKVLNENLPQCLRQTASRSHEWSTTSPKFWSMGEGAPGLPIAGSATG